MYRNSEGPFCCINRESSIHKLSFLSGHALYIQETNLPMAGFTQHQKDLNMHVDKTLINSPCTICIAGINKDLNRPEHQNERTLKLERNKPVYMLVTLSHTGYLLWRVRGSRLERFQLAGKKI